MYLYLEKEDPYLWFKKLFATTLISMLSFISLVMIASEVNTALARSSSKIEGNSGLVAIGEDSLVAVSNPADPIRTERLNVVVTAYSSTVCQTDDTPFITASGSYVEDGIVANNLLPFGTRIRMPEIYGDKIFIVEDRMHSRKGYYHVDIWFEEYTQAKNFGAKRTYIEVLEG
jgi:3D (Asp-Asp-Asp) domain-containing protein